jgi:signal transduction histidine kinase
VGADRLIQLATQVLFVSIFVLVSRTALQHRLRVNIDIALLFGLVAAIVAGQWITEILGHPPGQWAAPVFGSLLIALPFLLLRLVADYSDPPRLLTRTAAAGLAAGIGSLFLLPQPYPAAATLVYVAYFCGLAGYDAAAFMRAGRRASGVTRRRMYAVAGGCAALGTVSVIVGLERLLPWCMGVWQPLDDLWALGCGICFYVGFAPPRWLRHAWQEPAVRAYLAKAALLPRLPTVAAVVRELEQGVAESIGTDHAMIALWNTTSQTLRFVLGGHGFDVKPERLLAGRAFLTQRPLFSPDTVRENPAEAASYKQYRSHALLAAPISAGAKRFGVLVAFSAHAPIFADDDLKLLSMLADQAAIILESRALIDEATSVRAREEVTYLKEDFLTTAAHDLKTPLTTIIGQAQLLALQARRNPMDPADLAGIDRLVQEAGRMRTLVRELLDVSRIEQGRLIGARGVSDLVDLARQACVRHTTKMHPCTLVAPDCLLGSWDAMRMAQVFGNLLENAVKYSPRGGEVRVIIEQELDTAHIVVADQGIGIHDSDLPHVFDRFYRAANRDDRNATGFGLGLYISRRIIEEHGGRIWAVPDVNGVGSAFHIVLPVEVCAAQADLADSTLSDLKVSDVHV